MQYVVTHKRESVNVGEGEQAEGGAGTTAALETGAKPKKQSGHIDLGTECWRPS